jgi:hypothetical protein
VQDNAQEGIVDLKSAIVMNEAQFPEFIHEKVDSGARRADHLRQHFLRYFGVNPLLTGRRLRGRGGRWLGEFAAERRLRLVPRRWRIPANEGKILSHRRAARNSGVFVEGNLGY